MIKNSDSLAKRARQFMRRLGMSSLDDFQMHFAGFRIKVDADIVGTKVFDDPLEFAESSDLAEVEREKIINYLENCDMIFSITLSLNDDDGTRIGPYLIRCDGTWIWPSHYSYYLRKSDFSIMKRDFLSHIREQNYELTKLTKEQYSKARGFIEILVATNAGYL